MLPRVFPGLSQCPTALPSCATPVQHTKRHLVARVPDLALHVRVHALCIFVCVFLYVRPCWQRKRTLHLPPCRGCAPVQRAVAPRRRCRTSGSCATTCPTSSPTSRSTSRQVRRPAGPGPDAAGHARCAGPSALLPLMADHRCVGPALARGFNVSFSTADLLRRPYQTAPVDLGSIAVAPM